MALIECAKCGHKISEFAAACPKCGTIKSSDNPSSLPLETSENENNDESILQEHIEEPMSKSHKETPEKILSDKTETKKSNTGKIALFSLFGVAIIFLVLFLSGMFQKAEETTDGTPSINPIDKTNKDNQSHTVEELDDPNSEQRDVDYEPEEEEYFGEEEGLEEPTLNEVKNNLSYYAEANVDYRQKLITGVYDIQVAVSNNTPYTMKSVRVEVQYQRITNKVFDREYLTFSNIAPYSTVTMDAPNKSEGSYVAVQVIEGKVSK